MTIARGTNWSLLPMCLVLGTGLIPAASWAQITQKPSMHGITADGFFTNGQEWSDVTPILFNNGQSLTFVAVDPGKDALYLMFDEKGSTAAFGRNDLSGPVEFNVGTPPPGTGHHYSIFFNGSGIICLRDGQFFNVMGIMEGTRGFGSSPNSSTSHNMLELKVAFDCSDPSLLGPCAGVYSPESSHWGATISDGPAEPHCVLAHGDSCNSAAPDSVDCNTLGASQVFGAPISNACISVERGSGGVVRITRNPMPGETVGLPVGTTPHGTLTLSVAPNPFVGSTVVEFALAEPQEVQAAVCDVAGRQLRLLHSGWLGAGLKRLEWDGLDVSGRRCRGGIYFIRLVREDVTLLKKVILLR